MNLSEWIWGTLALLEIEFVVSLTDQEEAVCIKEIQVFGTLLGQA